MPVFHETHRYAYPVQTSTSGPWLGETGMTVCEFHGDAALAFLTQTGGADEVVYYKLWCDVEFSRHATPPGRNTIAALAFNPVTKRIWCGNSTVDANLVTAFEVGTGVETNVLTLPPSTNSVLGTGLATNGQVFARGSYETIELFTMNGIKLGERTYPGRHVEGITASPWSWTFVDSNAGEIVIINPLGIEVASIPGVGSPGGMGAIAFDTVSDPDFMPQLYDGTNCNLGDPGTLYHYDTDWSPQPLLQRHRLYVANTIDQIIYAGYLTA
ncbi:MAG: hypothetical protein GKR99_06510 [Rhodobacteraceae bacterium]|nr:hypothetical protein [Paracoccaceae bacterium]